MLRTAAKKSPGQQNTAVDPSEQSSTVQPQRQVYRGLRQDELEAYFEEQQHEGVCFRRCMLFVVVATLAFLVWLKWDRESLVADIEPVQKEGEAGDSADDPTEKYYDLLNVKKDDENRREKVEEAYRQMTEELAKGGKECEDCDKKLVLLKDAYNALSTHVANDYHKVLSIGKRAGFHDVKKAYLKAKQEAQEGKSRYELAEIKEAYDIMSHPEARVYYNLYGAKPPALMKHQQKVTHGGWGVEIGMGTFKYAILLAWLDYFNSGWVETGFFVCVFLVLAVKIWNNRHEFMEKIEQMEAMERMAMEGR